MTTDLFDPPGTSGAPTPSAHASHTPVGAPVGARVPNPDEIRKFEMSQAWEANRDQWGRPKVMLPDGSREVGYRRASSYGAPLENDKMLVDWKLRQVARGVARRKPLQLAITRAEVGLDVPDPRVQRKAKQDLNALAAEAMDAVGSGDAAVVGTGLHDVLEHLDLGRDPGHVPDEWRPDIDAYRALTDGLFETVSAERIVVQDDHQVGGSLDRAVRLLRDVEVDHPHAAPGAVLEAGSVVLADVKTAQSMDFAGPKFGVQCFCYATGIPYDPIGKTRLPWGHEPPRQDWAMILHVPSGQGRASIYWVDLALYREAAEQVRRVYAWRGRRGKSGIAEAATITAPPAAGPTTGPVVEREDFYATAAAAQSVAELMEAHQRAITAGAWDEALKAAFSARKAAILGGAA